MISDRKSYVQATIRGIVIMLFVWLSACSQSMEGTYTGMVSDPTGTMKVQFTFSPDGKVVTSVNGIQQTEGTYEIQDDQVKITMAEGERMTWKLLDDGSLETQMDGITTRLKPTK